MSKTRRKFLKSIGVGITGAMAAPTSLWGNTSEFLNSEIQRLALRTEETSEIFWEEVSAQFKFAEGLTYFNNASLGACPNPIRSATIDFQNTLDDFPSKYMWGGWDTEKERTRKQVAELFSVSDEEIALIHNTTEGMNLIARSLDLKPGDEVILADHEHASAVSPWKVWQEEKGIVLVRPTLPILPKKVKNWSRYIARPSHQKQKSFRCATWSTPME
ncbi:aminotransferase class V-fold PLP-dependent enzyme [Maribacter halichondriae]|uniref:aminotransferase class V-fold PLP-dependent enzyme n=1 Tax=Maribacter halichondriae TaxID=2980554 RepID=UPI002359C6FB|nr:aminotransferase class V-fold PLP-dependent enzyme [Maribacter sp. Hal144]